MQPILSSRRVAVFAGLFLALAASGCRYTAQTSNATGVQQFQQGNFQGAVQSFNRSLQIDPANADAYYNLARVYHRQASVSRRFEDYDQAERLYNYCLDRSPNHVDCHRALAVMLVEQNRTSDAFRLLERWTLREPMLSPAKVELARLYQEQGQRDPARNMLIQALAANPYDPRALAALGRMYEEEGDRNSALANYQRSLQANPQQPELSQRVAAMGGSPLMNGPMLASPIYPGQPQYPGQVMPGQVLPPYGTRTVTQPGFANSQRY